jgi:hypothetical protein
MTKASELGFVAQATHKMQSSWNNSTSFAPATRLTSALNADANMGHGFAIVMAHVGTLRPCGAPAPVN